MSTGQCLAMHRDGGRCPEPAGPGSRFCQYCGRNGGPGPLWVWKPPPGEPVSVAPLAPVEPASERPGASVESGTRAAASEVPPATLPATEPPDEGLEWLMGLLRQTLTEVVAGDAPPLQKASVVARLGALYLKARRSTELERANKELKRQ